MGYEALATAFLSVKPAHCYGKGDEMVFYYYSRKEKTAEGGKTIFLPSCEIHGYL